MNDFRLQKYIASINKEEVGGAHYKHISLYRPKDSMQYTMGWMISRYVLRAMNERLDHNAELDSLTPVSYTHLDVYKRQPL